MIAILAGVVPAVMAAPGDVAVAAGAFGH